MGNKSNKLLKTLVIIGSAASAIYIFNKFINDFASSKNKLRIKNESFYRWRYGNVYYQKYGSGSPILLLHDYSHCGSSYEWNKILTSLAEQHTVYTLDLLGCGRSDKPQITYTSFLYVQLINDFIDNIIKEKTTIIASGFSSVFSIMSSSYNKENIDKLILINPVNLDNFAKNTIYSAKILKTIFELPLVGNFVYNLLTTKNKIESQLADNMIYNPFQLDSDIIDTYYEAAHLGNGNGKYVLSSYLANYMNIHLSHGLQSIKNEILIIGGEQESGIHDIIDQYTFLNTNIDCILIPKTKRIPHFEQPELVLRNINLFL